MGAMCVRLKTKKRADDLTIEHLMARIKPIQKYRGPKKLAAHMSVVHKKPILRVNKYIYSIWQLNDGRVVKRRRLNPLFGADVDE
jgi:hypothetical protein